MMKMSRIVGKPPRWRCSRRASRSVGVALLWLALGASLVGCGQRGPLYLPAETPANTIPSASPTRP